MMRRGVLPFLFLALTLLAQGAGAGPAPTAQSIYLAGPASQCVAGAPVAVGVVCFDVPEGATGFRIDLRDRSGLPVGGEVAVWVSAGGFSMFGWPEPMCGSYTSASGWSDGLDDMEVFVWLGETPGCAAATIGIADFTAYG